MGITIFSLHSVLAPLQRMMAWLVRAPVDAHTRLAPARAHRIEGQRACAGRVSPPARHHHSARRPLRVLRVVDGAQSARGAGRMVISGRMADVCAELDRLAALEAAAH
jgi:hypothetical protein